MFKQAIFFLLAVAATIMISCNPATEQTASYRLLPTPQQQSFQGQSNLAPSAVQNYYLFDETVKLPVRDGLLKNIQASTKKINQSDLVLRISDDKDIISEGYELEIVKNQIKITAVDQANLFYGLVTLDQIMQDAIDQNVKLPICSISDYPMLSYRSIHLDIKHHMESLDYYYALIRQLAHYKINGIIVEMEDKLKYVRQPLIGSEDALSIQQFQQLSDYANERHIEISPLIQGLGHASFILKHPEYYALRDDPDSDWAFNPLDPETYNVQFDLYKDAIEATPHGKYLHIGGDEVHTTGRGSGRSQLDLQLSWLRKVCKFAEEQDRIPIFWDDMPLKHANVYAPMFNTQLGKEEVDKIWKENEYKLLEFLDSFPKNCIYMRWNYNKPQAVGNGKAMEWFREHGLQVMGATAGQTRWVLMPQNESNIENIKSFALTSIQNEIPGLLLTLWDDDSPHFELYKRGIIAFSQYTWNGDPTDNDEFKAMYRHREFSPDLFDSTYAFIDSLEIPVAFWRDELLKERRNNLKSRDKPSESLIDFPTRENRTQWLENNSARIAEAEKHLVQNLIIKEKIATMQSMTKRNMYNLEVYEQVNEIVTFSNNALISLKTYAQAETEIEISNAINNLNLIPNRLEQVKAKLEATYAKTRILTKPNNYILDQDHHVHLANQARSFDWQIFAEILFCEKITKVYGSDVINN